MGTITFNFWNDNNNFDPTWSYIQETVVDTWADWLVPVLIKTGGHLVNGVERDYGQLYLLAHKNPITPPTPTLTSTGEVTDGYNGPGLSPWFNFVYYAPGTIPGGGYEYGDFRFISNGTGSGWRGFLDDCYTFDTIQDCLDAIDNGEITRLDNVVYFDIYVDGTDKPSIFANWTASEDLGVSLSPRICIGCSSLVYWYDEYIEDPATNLMDVDLRNWNIDPAGSFSYAGSYETTYLSIQQHFEQYLNPISKAQRWGVDGEPDFVKLYLRMVDPTPDEGLDGIGQLATVTINKDGTASYIMVSGSSQSPGFDTVVRLHLQEEPDYVLPDDDPDYPGGSNIDDDGPGRYDPNNIPDPDDFTTPNGFDGNAILTKTYAVSESDLRNIGQKLWSQDYFNVLKIQSNPIENIVSVKAFPFAQTGTPEEVKVGDVAFGVNGDKVPSVWTKKMPNKFTYTGHFNNFLDFAPFTKIKMFLPYIGFIELDPGEIYQSPITVEYFVDLVTGQCMARLYTDENAQGKGIPFQSFYGNMGVDIPLSSTDRVQTEIRAASAAFSAGLGAAGMIVSGNTGGINAAVNGAVNIAGMDYNTQRSSTQSPTCCTFDCQDVYVMIIRPAADVIQEGERTGYQHLHGYPTNKYLKLSQIGSGNFVQVDRRTDIKISATSEENAMLERLLTEGVYV